MKRRYRFPVSTTLKERFSLELGLAETLVIDLSFKPYFDAFCRVLIAFSIFATIVLLLCVLDNSGHGL